MTRLTATLILLLLAAAAATAPRASAAYFIAQPPTYVRSGAGPFEWQFRSSSPGTSTGSFAYKLSTETVWHRCAKDNPPRLGSLAEGAYSITIADDIDLDWYNARGILFSGWTQPCWDSPTTAAPQTLPTTAMLYVDATAPSVSEPRVIVAELDTFVSVETSDAVAGVKSIEWSAGDGYTESGKPFMRHAYLVAGTWNASVTVTDNAGNVTTRPYTVTVTRPVPATPAQPRGSTPTPNTSPAPTDQAAPQVRVDAAARQRMRARGAAVMTVRCSELCTAVANGSLTIAGSRYKLRTARRSLPGGEAHTLQLALSGRTRRALSDALRSRRRVRVTLNVVATDNAGNSTRKTVRVTAL